MVRVLLVAGLVLAILSILLVLALAIPVDLWLRVERTQRTQLELGIGWLAGRLPQRIYLAPGEPKTPEPPPSAAEDAEQAPEETDEGPSARDRVAQGLALVRSEGFLGHTGRTLRRLLSSFHVQLLSLELRFGTGDPADTGILFGRLQAAMPVTYATPRVDVDLDPDFHRSIFEGAGELRLRATPLRLVWIGLVYALSPTTIRAVRAARRAGA